MSAPDHNYVLIIAGGGGTRLWPLSRRNRPKQFQKLASDKTLFQGMVDLSSQVVPRERIFVISIPEYHAEIASQVPELPKENILSEPALKDNGPAIALGMLYIHARDPLATVALLWSDHLIKKPKAFAAALSVAFEASHANPEQIVSVGTRPSFPDPTLGYIQMGHEVGKYLDTAVFTVRAFVEKPDLETAKEFVSSWEYLWNVGYRVMHVSSFFEALYQVRPDLQPPLNSLRSAVEISDATQLESAYAALTRESIEPMFINHLPSNSMLVVPADMGWSDVGSWNILHKELKNGRPDGLVTQGEVHTVSSHNSLLIAKDRPIMAVGIDNLVVVDSGDAIFVAHKDASQEIKDLLKNLEQSNADLL